MINEVIKIAILVGAFGYFFFTIAKQPKVKEFLEKIVQTIKDRQAQPKDDCEHNYEVIQRAFTSDGQRTVLVCKKCGGVKRV